MEIDFDLLFYTYVCKMGMSERGFWESPLRKVVKLADIYKDETAMKAAALNNEEYTPKYFYEEQEITEIHSMRELEGFVGG